MLLVSIFRGVSEEDSIVLDDSDDEAVSGSRSSRRQAASTRPRRGPINFSDDDSPEEFTPARKRRK